MAKRVVSRGLIDSLRKAFPEMDPPAEKDIAETLYPQEEWIRPALAGHKWTEVSSDDVALLGSDLPNLTLKAFHYYLPALILHAYQTHDEQFVWWVLAALKPDSIHGPALAKMVTKEQRRFITRFVDWSSTQEFNRMEARECKRLWLLE